jgi:hypothetical protein
MYFDGNRPCLAAIPGEVDDDRAIPFLATCKVLAILIIVFWPRVGRRIPRPFVALIATRRSYSGGMPATGGIALCHARIATSSPH